MMAVMSLDSNMGERDMFLAIRDGIIVEYSEKELPLLKLDKTTHEIVDWDGPLPKYDIGEGEKLLDPRSEAQKTTSNRQRYKRRRLRAYPSIRKQLDMIYHDQVDGTTLWVDEITRIKELFPKPTEV